MHSTVNVYNVVQTMWGHTHTVASQQFESKWCFSSTDKNDHWFFLVLVLLRTCTFMWLVFSPVTQDSLHSLMATLSVSNPFFVRCIKPNMDKVRYGASCKAALTTLYSFLPWRWLIFNNSSSDSCSAARQITFLY